MQQIKRRQKLVKNIINFTSRYNNLLVMQKNMDQNWQKFQEIKEKDIPQSYFSQDVSLSNIQDFKLLDPNWNANFDYTPNNELKKKFAASLFVDFIFSKKDLLSLGERLEEIHDFYSEITSLISFYNDPQTYIESPKIAETLVTNCCSVSVTNKRFCVDMDKISKFFYSICTICYSNTHLVYLLNDSVLEDVFSDFVDKKEKFKSSFVPDNEDSDYCSDDSDSETEIGNNAIDYEVFHENQEDNSTEKVIDTRRRSTRVLSIPVVLLTDYDDVKNRIKELPFYNDEYATYISHLVFNLLCFKGDSIQLSGVQFFPETGDGHCGFRSIANQLKVLTGKSISHIDVRKQALQCFMDCADKSSLAEGEVEQFVGVYELVISNGKEKSCVQFPRSWLDGVILPYVAKSQRVDIYVFFGSAETECYRYEYLNDDKIGSCHLLFWKDHYDTIIFEPKKYNQTHFEELLNRKWCQQYSSL